MFIIQIFSLFIMTYNDNLILRYLYGLDEKRDYPQSIKRFLMDVGSEIDEDRESAINELYGLKNNCKKLAQNIYHNLSIKVCNG